MDEADRPQANTRARRHLRRAGWGVALLSALLIVLAVGAGLLLSGRPVAAPRWVTAQTEARITEATGGALRAELGGVELFLEEGWHPRIRLTGLRLRTPAGREAASIPDMRLVLDRDSLLQGALRPARLDLPRVALALRRLEDGRFDVMLGPDRAEFRALGSLPEVLAAMDDILAAPVLDRLEAVTAGQVSVRLEDAMTDRVWTLEDGRLDLRQAGPDLRADLAFALAAEGEAEPARADLTFTTRKDSLAARLDVDLSGVPAADIAVQTPALAWLGVLEARVSGRLSAQTDAAGALAPVAGRLVIGPGRLSPEEGVRPIPFDGARLGFSYEPAAARLVFDEIGVDSPAMRFAATGQAFLQDAAGGLPRSVVAQVAISDLVADPAGLFDAPVAFEGGQADVKIRLDPFRVTLGQATLWEGGRHVSLSGTLDGAPGGWEVALDAAIDRIGYDRLMALWPPAVVPKTREWLKENVRAGEITDVRGAARLRPGEAPRFSLDYRFDAAEARPLRTLPPIQDGAGRASIHDTRYTMVVDRGHVVAPQGGAVDVAGTVFSVPDILAKPAIGELDLIASGSVTAGLSLLDQPPFQFLTKAGRPVDIAEGRAEVTAQARFPLLAHLPKEAVAYSVTARLSDLSSDRIVPGRRLVAKALDLTADPEVLVISGAGTLQGVPFTGRWTQPLAPGAASHLEAEVPLSPAAARAFAPGLPPDLIRGRAKGRLRVDLPRGADPRFTLTSDLTGAALAMPALGWAKPAGTEGRLEIAGRLGRPAALDRVSLRAPGLSLAEGRVTLGAEGGLERATFGRVKVGGWLDAPVELTGRGKGATPAVRLPSGTLDLRRLPKGTGGGAGGDSVPLDVTLDRVIISPSLQLTGLRGQMQAGGGVTGPFTARVNGGPAVAGTVSPAAIRVQGRDAGAVLAAAGITQRAQGGAFDLTLTPRGAGQDGRLRIAGLSVHDAPVLAQLLSAVSVVGLVEQLSGEGLVFDEVLAEFRLTPGAVEIKTASATGPSLGVTAAGVYLFEGSRMELTGVVTPVYLLNGLGSLVGAPGEGLFGFTYALSGPAAALSVSVNPLSVLAPGPLRKLFQRPAPRLVN